MKICYVTLGFVPAVKLGGPIQNAYHLTTNLARRGHEVTIVCTNLAAKNEKLFSGTLRQKRSGVEVIYFDTHRLFPLGLHSFGLFVSPGMIKFFREELKGYDVVHIDGYRDFPSMIASYYARKHAVPYVIQPRGSMAITSSSLVAKRMFDVLLGKRMLQACALLIASSAQEESAFCGVVPHGKETLRIYNGVDWTEFTNLPPRGKFRRRYGIHGRYLITYVGRLHAQKGIDVLIKAMAIIRQRASSHLAIVGPDDGYKRKLSSLADKLGLRDSVIFCEALTGREKSEAYVDSDVVVYATPSESFGMVPIEAAMCHVPAITSKGSACGEFLKRFEVGFTVPYGNPEALAIAIDSILERHTDVVRRVRGAAEGIRQALAWTVIAGEYELAYRSALKPRIADAMATEIS